MNQKYPRGSFVFVNVPESDKSMSHFTTNFIGIINGTYHQLYGGGDKKNYSIIVLDNHMKPINCTSWYKEHQLTLLPLNRKWGLKIKDKWDNRI